jgi:S1-C subfamily serine protease
MVPSLILAAALGLVALALVLRGYAGLGGGRPQVEPRPVLARGDLAEDEQATIELFETCSKSVAYVSPVIQRAERTWLGYRPYLETGTGSGFIWDDHGHVVTNFHVIQGASRCLVTLPDNTTYEASLTGYWADKDIAVLLIDAPAEKLVPVNVGTSHDLRVGQKVFAIGNPFGLDFTLTTGVVSALNREIEAVSGRTIQGVIQTDAAINPGNSGGPLLDSAGRLIGMNTAIYSQTGASAGIGFAVPVDTINRIVPQLISHGKVIRPGLGVNILDDWQAKRLGIDGVLIVSVAEGSAAEQAGLRPTHTTREGVVMGDIIVKVGDTPTPDGNALLNALERYKVGETVDVVVDRQGKRVTVPVTLQAVD